MPFKKNDPNINRSGRKKGTYSLKLRDQINAFCEDNLIYFLEDIKNMKSGHAKAQAFLNLLNYCLPKLTENNSTLDIENLTSDQIDKLFKKYLDE
jgi:hypothetical protein